MKRDRLQLVGILALALSVAVTGCASQEPTSKQTDTSVTQQATDATPEAVAPESPSRWSDSIDKGMLFISTPDEDGYSYVISFDDETVAGFGVSYPSIDPTTLPAVYADAVAQGETPPGGGCKFPLTEAGWLEVGNPVSDSFLIRHTVTNATADTITVTQVSDFNGNTRDVTYTGVTAPDPEAMKQSRGLGCSLSEDELRAKVEALGG
ncbi:hypothetical protein [Agromyces humi]|uniref:hypothetical protein n=1 Tax=Agromyces humi TaxID=1766800 RepID=UPI001356B88E|nr:hypothetical protein [Agromyces humi]